MDIQNLTPEQIQLILGSGEDDPANAQAGAKERIAQLLQRQGLSGLGGQQGQMAGRVYVGPSLLSSMGSAATAMAGDKMQNQANVMREGAHGRTVQGRQAYGNAMIEALRRKMNPQTPPQSMASPTVSGDAVDDFGGGGY